MHTNKDKLFAIAERQQGFFTSAQAIACGYPTPNHVYHVHAGGWQRMERGIYRLTRFPRTMEDQYVLWFLWSRDRSGEPQGVFSHQTALSIHGLSDIMPARLHLTVPIRFRRRVATPKIICLHKADLPNDALENRQGYRVVRPLRAIIDLLQDGTESEDHLRQALQQGLERGLITRSELRQHAKHAVLHSLLKRKFA